MVNGETRVRTKKGCINAKCTVDLENLQLLINQTNGVFEDTERFCEGSWIVIRRKILTKKNCDVTYSFTEVKAENLEDLRRLNKSLVFYKTNEKYYFTFVPQSFSFGSFPGRHCCSCTLDSHNTRDCENLSPNLCTKVFDRIKKIEEYSYIEEAFQALYTNTERFIVLKCSKCEYVESSRMTESEFLKHYRMDNHFSI